jgi:hypothetical protein
LDAHRWVSIVRWVARGWSLASGLVVVLVLVAERLSPADALPLTWVDRVALGLFPIGVLAGMALAWWRELAGGLLGLSSLLAFYLWMGVVWGRLPPGPYFVLFAAPALLFAITGGRARAASRRR